MRRQTMVLRERLPTSEDGTLDCSAQPASWREREQTSGEETVVEHKTEPWKTGRTGSMVLVGRLLWLGGISVDLIN